MFNRINFNEDDFDDELINYEEDDEYDALLSKDQEFSHSDDYMKGIELELVEQELSLSLLKQAVSLNKKSFGWRFLSFKVRLARIVETYKTLRSLLDS